MTSRTRRIVWSPRAHENRFIIGSTDLRMYQWSDDYSPAQDDTTADDNNDMRDDGDEGVLQHPRISLLAVNSDVTLMKCFAWSPSTEVEDLVAVGLTNGRTSLLRLQNQQVDTDASLPMAELVPKSSRACNVVSFNSAHPQLLVTGLDKVRNDHSLLVWDLSRATASQQAIRPLVQYGSSEAITSVSWFPALQPGLLGAGMGLKWLRIYDTRASSSSSTDAGNSNNNTAAPVLVTSTKAIYGMQVDPFHHARFASFTDDGTVMLWDMRRITEPVLQFPSADPASSLTRIAYSPESRGLLCSLTRESMHLDVHHVEQGPMQPLMGAAVSHGVLHVDQQEVAVSSSSLISASTAMSTGSQESLRTLPTSASSWLGSAGDIDVPVLWRSKKTRPVRSPLASFSWIPTGTRSGKKTIIAVSRSGAINHITLKSAPLFSFGSSGSRGSARTCLKVLDPLLSSVDSATTDMCFDSPIIESGYGMNAQENLALAGKNIIPHADVWRYIEHCDNMIASKSDASEMAYHGLLSMLEMKSVAMNMSARKSLIYGICDWPYSHDDVSQVIDSLESNFEWEKAAAWSVFNMEVPRAVAILRRSGQQQLKLVAAALASYDHKEPSNQTRQFLDLCQSLSMEMNSPYVRGIFSFIGSLSGASVLDILLDEEVELKTRICIALTFLTHSQLVDYIERLARDHVKRGDLNAILVTGMSMPECAELIQNYVDSTGDVQTAALIVSFAPQKFFSPALSTSPSTSSQSLMNAANRVNEWIESYRSILNKMHLFHVRCRFDIDRRRRYAKNQQDAVAMMPSPAPSPSTGNSPTTAIGPSASDIEQEIASSYHVPPQVYVRCNFCNHSIAHSSLVIPGIGMVSMGPSSISGNRNSGTSGASTPRKVRDSRTFGGSPQSVSTVAAPPIFPSSMHPSQRVKKMACPNCRKPLPRCAVCLLHMESNVSVMSAAADGIGEGGKGDHRIDWWFSWCQKCKHGGHAVHMSHWFESHFECPVAGCSCKCTI